MTIQEHKLNHEKSMSVCNKMGNEIQMKECYSNVFRATTHFHENFENGDWKVAYGYIQAIENNPLMTRHCFIVDKNGFAIDPTLMTTSSYKKGQNKKYITFFIFESVDEYLEAVASNDYIPDLIQPFWKYENEVSEPWAHENGLLLMR